MKVFGIFFGLVLAIYFHQSSDISAEDISDKTVLVSVNGQDITLGHVVSFQSRLSDQYKSMEDMALFDGILRQLIQQVILSQEIDVTTNKIKYAIENHIRAFLSNELVEGVSTVEVLDSDIKNLYSSFSKNFQPQTEYNASHILLETESEAKEILEKLINGADFAELAKIHSTGPSGQQGGSLGWFGKGAMVPAFESAVTLLGVNAVSEPVKTQFGWHVIKVNNIRETAIPKLEEVRGELISTIKQNRIEAEMNKLINSANVVYSDLEIDHKIIRRMSILND